MRRSFPLVCTLALAAVSTAGQAAPTVVGRVGLVAAGPLAADALGTGAHDGRALITVRVPGGAQRLRQAGLDARALAGDVAELRATAEDLRRLLALPDVVTVEERRILRPLLDASGPAIGAPAARAETGLDGSGALVAIIDTGVDFRHADLRHADGTTRVAAILDYMNPRADLHPELPDYNGGAIWLQADIDATLAADVTGVAAAVPVAEVDGNGHGTHVTGIAASNGLATGNGLPAGRYVGVAPGADIIAIQGTHGDATFTDSDVIAGCRFAVDQGQRLGRPVVANLSLGSNAGPHDGTSDLEAALDQLFPADQPGRALVIAAGNEGGRDQHAGAWALDGSVTIPLDLGSSGQADAQLAFEVWHTGGFAITVISPAGHKYGPAKLGVVLNGPMTAEGQVLVDNGSSGPRADGRQTASIAIEGPAGASPAAGRWTLVFDGHAPRWDVWITDEPAASTPAHFVDRVAEDDRLDMPATARNAITVGSFVTRNQWTTVDGMAVTRTAVVGTPSSFSSSGPTADDRFAPDVIAPGEYIVSALSMDASPDSPTSAFFVAPGSHLTWGDDGVHAILRGTSQAAPHVVGAVALLFQADPTLTPNSAREILRVTANDGGGGGFTPKLGFGKLDVLAAARFARGQRGAGVSATASSVGVSRDVVPPGDETTVVTVTPRGDDGTPLGSGRVVAITTTAGDPASDVVDLGSGRYERTFAAHAPRGTVAIVTAVVDGVTLAAHPSIYMVNARSEIGAPFAATGGCSLTPAPASPAGLLLVGFLLVLRRRKSRYRALGRTLGA